MLYDPARRIARLDGTTKSAPESRLSLILQATATGRFQERDDDSKTSD
jgi:hypothetical protein